MLPEITVRDRANGLTQLSLDPRRNRDHQIDQLALDRCNLIQRQLVVSILVCPIPLNEVLEAEGAGKANIVGEGVRCSDLEEL